MAPWRTRDCCSPVRSPHGTALGDSRANLVLDGIVNNPNYAVNNAQRGKPYSYRVRASFDAITGSGERVGKRKCFFRFNKI